MRVSLLNLNLVSKDAVGRSLKDRAYLLRAAGHQVRIYIQHPPEDAPQDILALCVVCSLKQLIGQGPEFAALREHFFTSDLYIYDYPNWYELIESIRGVDRGAVILDYHSVTPPELWGSKEALDMLQRSIDELPQLLRHVDYAVAHSDFTRREIAV